MSRFTFSSAIAALRIISSKSTVAAYWNKQYQTAEEKNKVSKIMDGHSVSNPLAYFLVPMLGAKGRAVPEKFKELCDTHSYALLQFAFACENGWTRKTDLHLRSVTPESIKAIDVGFFQSLPRGDSLQFGSKEIRELAHKTTALDAPDKGKIANLLATAQNANDGIVAITSLNSAIQQYDSLAARIAAAQARRDEKLKTAPAPAPAPVAPVVPEKTELEALIERRPQEAPRLIEKPETKPARAPRSRSLGKK